MSNLLCPHGKPMTSKTVYGVRIFYHAKNVPCALVDKVATKPYMVVRHMAQASNFEESPLTYASVGASYPVRQAMYAAMAEASPKELERLLTVLLRSISLRLDALPGRMQMTQIPAREALDELLLVFKNPSVVVTNLSIVAKKLNQPPVSHVGMNERVGKNARAEMLSLLDGELKAAASSISATIRADLNVYRESAAYMRSLGNAMGNLAKTLPKRP